MDIYGFYFQGRARRKVEIYSSGGGKIKGDIL
jgi:hypothetical protein